MDIDQNILDTLQHIMVPILEDTIPISLEQCRSPGIITRPRLMLPAIHFDDKFRLWANEIDDIPVDWYLSSKAKTFDLPRAQMLPQFQFSVGHCLAQSSGAQSANVHIGFSFGSKALPLPGPPLRLRRKGGSGSGPALGKHLKQAALLPPFRRRRRGGSGWGKAVEIDNSLQPDTSSICRKTPRRRPGHSRSRSAHRGVCSRHPTSGAMACVVPSSSSLPA